MRLRRLTAAAAVAVAAGAAGCGAGAGDGPTGVSVRVTRDFGAARLGSAELDRVPEGETVMRLLSRSFDVETRYGGGFVQSIDGLAGGGSGGRRRDWFFYVNGIESGEGAAARRIEAGDRVWWDHHDWGAAMRVPAVVGSFPEPFVSGSEGRRLPVRVDCAPGFQRVCGEVARRLTEAGVTAAPKASIGAPVGKETLRIVVGPWAIVRTDSAARVLERGPATSGVFARPNPRTRRLDLLDERGQVDRSIGPGSGLVAATRVIEQQPTWVVTGMDEAGVAAAASALEEGILQDRFAVAVEDGLSVPLPVRRER